MMLSEEFLTVATFHILAAMSPGPDFAVVCKNSISHGRAVGIATAVGISIGLAVHIFYCLIGIGVVISQSIILFNVMKLAAACYLIWIGVKAIRSKASDIDIHRDARSEQSILGGFQNGLITNALNPKAALFFLALFTVSVSSTTSVYTKCFYGIWMMIATMGWFSAVAVFFSNSRVRGVFLRFGHWFDRVMGVLLVLFGIKIASVPSSR